MKFSLSPLLLLLPTLTLSSPTPLKADISTRDTTSPANDLLKRDRVCWIIAGEPAGCDTTPTSQVRVGVLAPGSANGPTFGVGCWQYGRSYTADGYTSRTWYYVPARGYQCYVWAGWVNRACNGKFFFE